MIRLSLDKRSTGIATIEQAAVQIVKWQNARP
jgi:hypothetical protein